MMTTTPALRAGRLPIRALAWWVLAAIAALPAAAAELEAWLAWERRASLSTPVAGVIGEVLVTPGDRVAAGEVLLRLDPRPFQARETAARARLDRLRPRYAEAQRERDRAQELYDRTVLSDHELQTAKIAHAAALADLTEARAQLKLAQLEREYSELKAPFAGLVVARRAEPGEVVVQGDRPMELLVLASGERMEAVALVDLTTLAGLKPGAPATVTVAGRSLAGTVTRLGLEPAGSGEGNYAVGVSFEPPGDLLLRPGQPAKVILP